MYCVIPGRPQLEWKSCITRDESRTGSHVSFLASTDDASLYCPTCRPHDREAFVEIADRIYASIASGNKAEGIVADSAFARMLIKITAKRVRPTLSSEPVSVAADETPSPRVASADDREVRAGSDTSSQPQPVYTAHCCPRIVLGHGLHSPTCAKYAGEDSGLTAPSPAATDAVPSRPEPVDATTRPAILRDDPKAEAGSFERFTPWRPKYRDRADWDEWRHERAAIFEYEGGYQRKHAETAANRLAGPPP